MNAITNDRLSSHAMKGRLKRIADVVGAAALLAATVPILVSVAVLVKLSSPGPVLFRQERVGRNGKLFRLLKFRSMQTRNGGPAVTSGQDVRVTPIGRFLRHWKLDELPQLVNVLRGDMSLVGPRPEVPRYVAFYTEEQRRVLSVRPGITGLAQLEFRHEETLLACQGDVEEYYVARVMPAKLAIDLRYVNRWSLVEDSRLLGCTVLALFRPFEADGAAEDSLASVG